MLFIKYVRTDIRSRHPEAFLGKGALNICSRFTAKQLYWNHTSAWCSPVNLLSNFLSNYHSAFPTFFVKYHVVFQDQSGDDNILTWLRSLYFSFWVYMLYCVQRTSSQKILWKLLFPILANLTELYENYLRIKTTVLKKTLRFSEI